jgi:hypothetical protein
LAPLTHGWSRLVCRSKRFHCLSLCSSLNG